MQGVIVKAEEVELKKHPSPKVSGMSIRKVSSEGEPFSVHAWEVEPGGDGVADPVVELFVDVFGIGLQGHEEPSAAGEDSPDDHGVVQQILNTLKPA